jgi:hypothetical protein
VLIDRFPWFERVWRLLAGILVRQRFHYRHRGPWSEWAQNNKSRIIANGHCVQELVKWLAIGSIVGIVQQRHQP